MENLTKTIKIGGTFMILVLMFITFQLTVQKEQPISVGSVQQGNEYHFISTKQGGSISNPIKTGTGALGSVVITGAAAWKFDIYDATTTDASARGGVATSSLTRLASFPLSTAAGTYTFDTYFKDGMIIDYSGTMGTSTITYR